MDVKRLKHDIKIEFKEELDEIINKVEFVAGLKNEVKEEEECKDAVKMEMKEENMYYYNGVIKEELREGIKSEVKEDMIEMYEEFEYEQPRDGEEHIISTENPPPDIRGDISMCGDHKSENDLKEKQRAQGKERQARHRHNENEEQRQQRLSKNRIRIRNKNITDEQKKQRREYMRKYQAQRRKSETPEQHEKRLSKQREYLENMDDDKYYKMLDKSADYFRNRCRHETEEQRKQRLYNKRLSYAYNLSLLNEEELQQYREGERKRASEYQGSASKEKIQEIKTKNRDRMRCFGHIYKRNAKERRFRSYIFERAKDYNLIPAHSDVSSDTGSEPYLSYLQRNRLFKDRSIKGLHKDLKINGV